MVELPPTMLEMEWAATPPCFEEEAEGRPVKPHRREMSERFAHAASAAAETPSPV